MLKIIKVAKRTCRIHRYEEFTVKLVLIICGVRYKMRKRFCFQVRKRCQFYATVVWLLHSTKYEPRHNSLEKIIFLKDRLSLTCVTRVLLPLLNVIKCNARCNHTTMMQWVYFWFRRRLLFLDATGRLPTSVKRCNLEWLPSSKQRYKWRQLSVTSYTRRSRQSWLQLQSIFPLRTNISMVVLDVNQCKLRLRWRRYVRQNLFP